MESEESNKRCESCSVRLINELSSMTKDELKQVSSTKTIKKIKKGDTLFKEGDRLIGIFCIQKGVSKISKLCTNGNEQIIHLAGKGTIIGQRAIINEERIGLNATALCDMDVCFIPKSNITGPLKKNYKFTNELLKTLTNNLKEADTTIINRSQKSVKQRLACALLKLQENYGNDENGYIKLVLMREDLASLIGTAKESCIRNISILNKENLIKVSGKKIGVLNKQELEKIFEGKRYKN